MLDLLIEERILRLPEDSSRRGPSPALEVLERVYRSRPHRCLHVPLCKVRGRLERSHFMFATDGSRVRALVAYTSRSIEAGWSAPGCDDSLDLLLSQASRRMERVDFLALEREHARRWQQELGLRVVCRCYRAVLAGRESLEGAPQGYVFVPVTSTGDEEEVARMVRAAYPSLRGRVGGGSPNRILSAPYYRQGASLFLREAESGRNVGLVVAGYDPASGEGFIDWVQVDERLRGRGLGRALVSEAVRRLEDAAFFTVGGSLDAPFAFGRLYKSLGFRETVEWVVLGRGEGA